MSERRKLISFSATLFFFREHNEVDERIFLFLVYRRSLAYPAGRVEVVEAGRGLFIAWLGLNSFSPLRVGIYSR